MLRAREWDFVQAARALGASSTRILVRHILPGALPAITVQATLGMGAAILSEASLSFLGLSSADIISWGRMLNAGQRFLFNAWWMSVFPGLAIFLTVLAFNLLGDAIGSALNPRTITR